MPGGTDDNVDNSLIKIDGSPMEGASTFFITRVAPEVPTTVTVNADDFENGHITITDHNLFQGDALLWRLEGETSANLYFVNVIDADTISLSQTADGRTPASLFAGEKVRLRIQSVAEFSSGSEHRLHR
ncbi:hypothetical protein QW131_31980 [Roseibium salinum]|nr:hypothetical protein [Roseibium salinum]